MVTMTNSPQEVCCSGAVSLSTRVVELSHVLYPGKEQYKLEIKPQKERTGPGSILYEVALWSHVGTHVEYALHFLPNGRDISTLPLRRLVGEAAIVDLRHKQTNEPIDIEDFMAADIRERDIVITWTGRDNLYRTPNSHDRPYVTKKAADWLANDRKISALGTDSSGFEVRGGAEHEPNHFIFFDREDPIPVIECMGHLGELTQKRVFLIALPMRIVGLDAWPVRVIAIEGNAETNDVVLAQLSNLFALP
ncbi:MAG: cyclase family protein [Chloroflexi bacterium]|nr:cyclase family protein [Chloroflexota bacterium]